MKKSLSEIQKGLKFISERFLFPDETGAEILE